MITGTNQVDKIIAYENGELTRAEIIELFSHLIKTDLAWSLQGHYGRIASGLIENGILDIDGEILDGAHTDEF